MKTLAAAVLAVSVSAFAADFDGDGIPEPALLDTATGRVVAWNVRNPDWVLNHDIRFGVRPARFAAADYDGDGKTDVAVYYPPFDGAGSIWRAWLSTGDAQVVGGIVSWSFGWPDGYPVPADYDGDGRADPALYSTDGTWRMVCSTAGYQQRHYGHPGALPGLAGIYRPQVIYAVRSLADGPGETLWKPDAEGGGGGSLALLPTASQPPATPVVKFCRNPDGTGALFAFAFHGAQDGSRVKWRYNPKSGEAIYATWGLGPYYVVEFRANGNMQPWGPLNDPRDRVD